MRSTTRHVIWFLRKLTCSLAATSIPACLEVSATAADGEVMAVRHRELQVDGVQFHPESVLTPTGPKLGKNFLEGS